MSSRNSTQLERRAYYHFCPLHILSFVAMDVQVVQDSRWLRLQQQQEHMRLECQVAELSMENRELQAHNMELERQCAALTSPTRWV